VSFPLAHHSWTALSGGAKLINDIDKLQWKGPPADNITPGVHIARCVGSNLSSAFPKLYLHFVIEDGSDKGKTTFMAFNVRENGRFSTSSKYYMLFTKLRGNPSRKDTKMSPRVFHGHLYKVKVELRHLRNSDGEPEYSEDHEYGLVTEILEEVEDRVSC
jgi:hypothetical protein